MFCISLDLRLPFHWFPEINIPGFCWHGKVSKNKAWEVQLGMFTPSHLLGITLDTRMSGSDHAGLRFELFLLGALFAAQLHDVRHWNHEAKRFQTDEEAQAEHEEWEKKVAGELGC